MTKFPLIADECIVPMIPGIKYGMQTKKDVNTRKLQSMEKRGLLIIQGSDFVCQIYTLVETTTLHAMHRCIASLYHFFNKGKHSKKRSWHQSGSVSSNQRVHSCNQSYLDNIYPDTLNG